MPLFEYQCTTCKERVTILQKVSDSPFPQCPSCGGETKKLFSAPAIQFKGSGFYKTDYATAPRSDAKSESASDSKSDSKSDTKSEVKSDTKTEAKSETKSESRTETKTESKAD